MPFAAALAPGCQPQRLELVLGDGYRTSVLLHAGRGEHRRLPVLYVHGIQSHPGWFVKSASALADDGHDVYQVTRRGSGDNLAGRGQAQSAGQLLDDLERAGRFALERSAATSLHLMGVSWGGKLCACYAVDARRSVDIASLTLLAPGIVPRVDVPATTKLSIALALLVCPHRRFDIPLSDPELFTDNPAMRQYLASDPCRLHRATARFLYASRQLDIRLRRAARGALAMPTTLILAASDKIVDNQPTLAAIERLCREKISVRTLPGAHTLEFEPDTMPLEQSLLTATREKQNVGRAT